MVDQYVLLVVGAIDIVRAEPQVKQAVRGVPTHLVFRDVVWYEPVSNLMDKIDGLVLAYRGGVHHGSRARHVVRVDQTLIVLEGQI